MRCKVRADLHLEMGHFWRGLKQNKKNETNTEIQLTHHISLSDWLCQISLDASPPQKQLSKRCQQESPRQHDIRNTVLQERGKRSLELLRQFAASTNSEVRENGGTQSPTRHVVPEPEYLTPNSLSHRLLRLSILKFDGLSRQSILLAPEWGSSSSRDSGRRPGTAVRGSR